MEGTGLEMNRYRNYWIYSLGLVVAWAVVIILSLMIRGRQNAQPILLIFFGFCIGWVSTTIARYVYPPPKRWESNHYQE
jgi:hypothetical protein